jgi:hypothetical protein
VFPASGITDVRAQADTANAANKTHLPDTAISIFLAFVAVTTPIDISAIVKKGQARKPK